jgi:glycosyltransferase involved in cell wall biosynthesis
MDRQAVTELAVAEEGKPLRVLVVSDAWVPQVNGVVRTLQRLGCELEQLGHTVRYITPDQFRTIPCPSYPEIRLSINHWNKVGGTISEFRPSAIHIATEGPLGLAARSFCLNHNLPFTTSFHTRFPEYLHARLFVPLSWTYSYLRDFHVKARRTMAATPSLQSELIGRGFTNIVIWSRGVDTELFRPRPDLRAADYRGLKRPIWLYVGRVAIEKNIEAFLRLDLEGSKLIVGDGPALAGLKRQFPDVDFAGALFGEQLSQAYAAANCFVFPSRTDTFGLVLLEALACGTPVAAYPVMGPRDVVGDAPVGVLREDLESACRQALTIPATAARNFATQFSWTASARQFLGNLALNRTHTSPQAIEDLPSGRHRIHAA